MRRLIIAWVGVKKTHTLTLGPWWLFSRYNIGFQGGWFFGCLHYSWHDYAAFDAVYAAAQQSNMELGA
jgi:hypothetical protein